MKVMGIDTNGQPALVDMTLGHHDDLLRAHTKKIKHAYKHWKDYRGGDGKYEEISKHAWQALLIALDDFFTNLPNHLTDYEKEEFKRFWEAQK